MPFTPGPWTIEVFPACDCDDDNACTAITALANEDGKEGFLLAEVNRWAHGDDPATDESDCNARLICAAPSLLAACKEYIAYREGNDGNIDQIAGRMKAAIRLAENSADCS